MKFTLQKVRNLMDRRCWFMDQTGVVNLKHFDRGLLWNPAKQLIEMCFK